MANDGQAAAATTTSNEPYRAYNFRIEIQDVANGHFTAVSAPPSVEVDALEYREGGEHQVVRRLIGPTRFGEVVLRYGLVKADSEGLWNWLQGAMNATVTRKNVTIVMLSVDNTVPVVRWHLNDAWPTKWSGAPLDALGREIAIESITLVYESLIRE